MNLIGITRTETTLTITHRVKGKQIFTRGHHHPLFVFDSALQANTPTATSRLPPPYPTALCYVTGIAIDTQGVAGVTPHRIKIRGIRIESPMAPLAPWMTEWIPYPHMTRVERIAFKTLQEAATNYLSGEHQNRLIGAKEQGL